MAPRCGLVRARWCRQMRCRPPARSRLALNALRCLHVQDRLDDEAWRAEQALFRTLRKVREECHDDPQATHPGSHPWHAREPCARVMRFWPSPRRRPQGARSPRACAWIPEARSTSSGRKPVRASPVHIFFNRSTDRGQSWPPEARRPRCGETRVGHGRPAHAWTATGNGHVYAVWWTKHRDGTKDVLFSTLAGISGRPSRPPSS